MRPSSGSPLTANHKRIAGKEDVAVTPDEAMVDGVPSPGKPYPPEGPPGPFAGAGDLFPVGLCTPPFQEKYASIKLLHQTDRGRTTRGESYQWLMRLK